MENAVNVNNNDNKGTNLTLTANEVANVLGESYKTVVKRLNTLATEGKIEVTEKAVNNRVLKGYILNISDLQDIKDNFLKNKHLENKENAINIQMLANANNNGNTAVLENDNTTNPNVKIYEVMRENAELTKEIDKLKTDIQSKINENVRLDADLSVAKSELKLIEAKSNSMESAYSEKKLEVERLVKVVKSRNIALIILSALMLIGVTALVMYLLLGIK